MAGNLEDAFLAVLDEIERGRTITRDWLDAQYPEWSADLAGALEIKQTLQGRVGPYRCLEELGRGGMGTVYLARLEDGDVSDPGPVALKVIHRRLVERPGILTRLLNEAEACRHLEHENIVRTLDLGTVERGGHRDFYLVLEHLHGKTLRERLEQEGPLPESECIAVASAVAGALQAIHASGALHLDLKPENVFLTDDGCIKVMDFGVARLAAEPALDAPGGAFAGTLMYAAPEQFQAERRHLDARADLYSLGVLLFELGCGRLPDDDDAPGVSRFFDHIVTTLLALDPDDRFQSARELSRALLARQWRGRSGFVGRAAELGKLHEALGRGGAVVIDGEAGAGKSRLLDEFLAEVQDAGIAVLRADSLRSLAIAHAESPFFSDAPVLAEALRSGAPTAEDLDAALARIARGTARGGPSVLVIEDLHRREATELRAFATLARALTGQRMLLAGTSRQATELPGVERLALDRLTEEDLADLAARRGETEDAAGKLHEISGGNALFATLVLDAWAEDGRSSGSVGAPKAVEDMVRVRLERLGPGDRRILDLAGCLGRLDLALLAPAAGHEPADADAFAHDLFREVAAALLSDGARRENHATLAGVLPPGAERVRHVLLSGGDVTADELAAALQELRGALRDREGVELAELAEERDTGFDRVELLRSRGHFLSQIGRYEEAEAAYREALALASATPDAAPGIRVRVGYITLLSKLSRYKEGRRQAHEAHALARSSGDPALEYQALAQLCDVLIFVGRPRPAEAVGRRMIRRATEAFGEVPAMAYQSLAKISKLVSKPDRAIHYFEEALRVARLPEDLPAVMLVEGHYGLLLMNMGRFAESRTRCLRAATIARESGRRYPEAMVQTVLSELAEREGHLRDGIAATERAVELFEQLGSLDGLVRCETMRMHFATVLNDRRLFDEALARSTALSAKTETYAIDSVRGMFRAEWARRDGDLRAAQEHYAQAVANSTNLGHQSGIASGNLGLGRCLAAHDPDAAARCYRTAYAIAERMQEADLLAGTLTLLACLPGGDVAPAREAYEQMASRMAVTTRIEMTHVLWTLTEDDQVLLEARRLVHTLSLNAPEEQRENVARHPVYAAVLKASRERFGSAAE